MLITYFAIIVGIYHLINGVKSAPTNLTNSFNINIVSTRRREIEHVDELIPRDVDTVLKENSTSGAISTTISSQDESTIQVSVLPWEENDIAVQGDANNSSQNNTSSDVTTFTTTLSSPSFASGKISLLSNLNL